MRERCGGKPGPAVAGLLVCIPVNRARHVLARDTFILSPPRLAGYLRRRRWDQPSPHGASGTEQLLGCDPTPQKLPGATAPFPFASLDPNAT